VLTEDPREIDAEPQWLWTALVNGDQQRTPRPVKHPRCHRAPPMAVAIMAAALKTRAAAMKQ
jgi:hypothetical protein